MPLYVTLLSCKFLCPHPCFLLTTYGYSVELHHETPCLSVRVEKRSTNWWDRVRFTLSHLDDNTPNQDTTRRGPKHGRDTGRSSVNLLFGVRRETWFPGRHDLNWRDDEVKNHKRWPSELWSGTGRSPCPSYRPWQKEVPGIWTTRESDLTKRGSLGKLKKGMEEVQNVFKQKVSPGKDRWRNFKVGGDYDE